MSSFRLPLAIYAAVVSLSAGRLSEDARECLNRYGSVVEAFFEVSIKFIGRKRVYVSP